MKKIVFDITDFRAEISLLSEPTVFKCNVTIGLPVRVTNLSEATWPSVGRNMLCLSYHWRKPAGDVIEFDGLRTHLPYSLNPGDSASIDIIIQTPSLPGKYHLVISLVQENIAWFEDKGFIPTVIEIDLV